jgi:fructose-bisphosphate aldolase, class I
MTERLEDVAARLVAPGKGILAADESNGTCTRRFEALGIASSPETRRDYREMLFRTGEGMRNFVSGVILYDETIRQNAEDGTPLVKIISDAGSIPGIKVDAGTKPLALAPGETITEGLDGLRERLKEYYGLGARFAKWRAVINIGPGMPSANAIHANAHALARYAALCQEAMIVPIVEPEVVMDGAPATHDADTYDAATEKTLRAVFDELSIAGVNLRGMVLKPNMVTAGKNSPKQASPAQVAEKTVQLLKAVVPADVPGIAFLSGGQSDRQATEHLSLMNEMGKLPWRLTFSYGRALQAAAMKTWAGKADNVPAAQSAFLLRVRMNSLAASGRWAPDLEKQAA